MGGLRERKGDDIVFAGLVTSTDEASVIANSQHRSSKLYSSIPPRSFSYCPSTSSQSLLSYSSSAPLLIQLESLHQGAEESPSRGPPQAASTPFVFSVRDRDGIAHSTNKKDINSKLQPSKRVSSPDLPADDASAVRSHCDRTWRELLVRATGESQLSALCRAATHRTIVDQNYRKHISFFVRGSIPQLK